MCRSFYAALETGAPIPEIAENWIRRETRECVEEEYEEDRCRAGIEYELYKRGANLGTDAGWGRSSQRG